MFKLKTILAATDLTRRSGAVVARAVQLAKAHGARLILVTVVEPRNRTVARFRLRRASDPVCNARAELERLRANHPGLDITCHVATGAPATIISDLAELEEADLIVLGLHLPRRVLETMRLTNLERIAQAARCPVLIAHTNDVAPYRKILGAVTFAPASAEALRVASCLAPEADLSAIHALQLPLRAKLPLTDLKATPEMTEAELLRGAFMAMDGLPQGLQKPEIVPGGVHEVLQFRIAELKPDLVVIGSHSGRDPENLGNYARDLLRAPPTDTLVAKPG